MPAPPGPAPPLQLRLINTAAFAQFQFSVDNHRLIVVSLDGLTVHPSQPLRGVVLNAGQRVDVLVCPDGPRRRLADWQPAWVRAHMIQVRGRPAPGAAGLDCGPVESVRACQCSSSGRRPVGGAAPSSVPLASCAATGPPPPPPLQSVFASDSPDPTVLGVLQYGRRTSRPRRLPTTQPTELKLSEVGRQVPRLGSQYAAR